MTAEKVIFICKHNSARSQMAEAFLKQLAGDRLQVESAGLEPGALNPLVVESMKEIGFDISQNTTQSVFDLFKAGKLFDIVVTVCDDATEAQCPVFPGVTRRLHWPFPDPAALEGSHEEKLAKVREIREAIKSKVEEAFSETLKD